MVSFFNETDFTLPYKKNTLKRWVKAIATSENRKVGAINYIFCDDDYLHRINVQYLAHDTLTDIITFDYSAGAVLAGDLYISLDTVRTNAEMLGKNYDDELHRVLVHGVLHLVGINDKGPGEREIMEAAEDAALALR